MKLGAPELSSTRPSDLAAERLCHKLLAVTNTEHWDPQSEQAFIDPGSGGRVNRHGPSGKDNAGRLKSPDPIHGEVVWHDLGKDMAFAHSSRDQLRILGTVVDNQDLFHY